MIAHVHYIDRRKTMTEKFEETIQKATQVLYDGRLKEALDLSRPIYDGHPSLVAENGPELVIGRETTQAMMMNNPQLLKALVNYDRNYSGRRAYDAGNIAEVSPTIAPQSSTTDEMVSAQANTNIALLQAVNTLLQRLEQPIEAKIDMYGRGKLYDSMTKADRFMKNKS